MQRHLIVQGADFRYFLVRNPFGGEPPGEARPVKADAAKLAAEALAGLARLVAAFDDPATPYAAVPRADWAPRYNDYLHLARVKEWAVQAAQEEG